ncbi:MAG: GGDEF domain-containing protein [Hoeflea sp.]|nr:GGDEF domain-containing protein [Hoeflea sp.]
MRSRNDAKSESADNVPKQARRLSRVEALKAELAAAQRRIKELEARADEDPLLPLLNRRGFMREMDRALAYARRYGAKASLVYLDLDEFKLVNDTYGHAAGDRVLAAVAGLLLANVRRSDVVGRLGGDEFAVILWNTDGAVAEAKAEGLAWAIAAASLAEASEIVRLSASYGVTPLLGDDTADRVLTRADLAMYAQKKGARQAQ